MTAMPQMIALFNGMGGGAAAAIAAVELIKGGAAVAARRPTDVAILAVVGALIGAVSFGGSLIAFAKLQGLIKRVLSLPRPERGRPARAGDRRRRRRARRPRRDRHGQARRHAARGGLHRRRLRCSASS